MYRHHTSSSLSSQRRIIACTDTISLIMSNQNQWKKGTSHCDTIPLPLPAHKSERRVLPVRLELRAAQNSKLNMDVYAWTLQRDLSSLLTSILDSKLEIQNGAHCPTFSHPWTCSLYPSPHIHFTRLQKARTLWVFEKLKPHPLLHFEHKCWKIFQVESGPKKKIRQDSACAVVMQPSPASNSSALLPIRPYSQISHHYKMSLRHNPTDTFKFLTSLPPSLSCVPEGLWRQYIRPLLENGVEIYWFEEYGYNTQHLLQNIEELVILRLVSLAIRTYMNFAFINRTWCIENEIWCVLFLYWGSFDWRGWNSALNVMAS
jgi:hypothetical protein